MLNGESSAIRTVRTAKSQLLSPFRYVLLFAVPTAASLEVLITPDTMFVASTFALPVSAQLTSKLLEVLTSPNTVIFCATKSALPLPVCTKLIGLAVTPLILANASARNTCTENVFTLGVPT